MTLATPMLSRSIGLKLDDPLPEDSTESATRLLNAFSAHSALLLVRVLNEHAGRWLDHGRLERSIGQALMGPTEIEIWSPTPQTRAVALKFPSDSRSPIRPLEVHSVCQFFVRQLSQAWQEENETEPPFSVMPISPLVHMDGLQENIAELNSLLEILVNRQLTPQFQPIVNLRDGRVFAYETLIRGPKGALVRRPGQMFRVADKARVVAWFDLACLEECLKRASEQKLKHLLFVNMDAEGLSALSMQDRPIALRVREHGLSPAEIVIEVTERQMVGDFPRFIEDMNLLREQGFRIAIDDAGAGYSSLRAISELKPDFVKIDRDLVKNIDVAGERRELLRAIAQYARSTGASVIAEGAETREELTTLVDLGIPYCQGYVLGKPSDSLRGTPREMREFVQRRVATREQQHGGADISVGLLARPGLWVEGTTPLSEAARRFSKEPGLTSIAVMEAGKITGLLLRRQLEHVLVLVKAAQAAEMMPAEMVCRWMRTDILRVSSDARIQEVLQQVISRQSLELDADILVLEPSGAYWGVVSVRALMEAVADRTVNRALYSDPLTSLPGRVLLERELDARLLAQGSLGVVRVDINRLSAINSHFGLTRGNSVIIELAEAIKGASARHGRSDDFIAHLGGDDFVVLTGAKEAGPLCAGMLEICKVNSQAKSMVREQALGVASPQGSSVTISMAAITNRHRRIETPEQVMSALFDLMRQVKSQPGSRFACD